MALLNDCALAAKALRPSVPILPTRHSWDIMEDGIWISTVRGWRDRHEIEKD